MAKNVQPLVKAKIEVEGMRNIIFNALPQNITNGDVIRIMFPNAEIDANPYSPSVDIFVDGFLMIRVDRNWWNAPYKR